MSFKIANFLIFFPEIVQLSNTFVRTTRQCKLAIYPDNLSGQLSGQNPYILPSHH